MNQPDKKNLQRLADACRPHGDDLDQAELASLREALELDAGLRLDFEKSRLLDQKIREALHREKIPVPPNLLPQLVSMLALEPNLPRVQEVHNVQTAGRVGAFLRSLKEGISRGMSRKVTRRRWMLGSLAATSVMAVFLLWSWRAQEWDPASLAQYAKQYRLAELASSQSPKTGVVTVSHQLPPPEDFPLSRSIFYSMQGRRRSLSDFLSHRGVAYDVSSARGKTATLYVISAPRKLVGMMTSPPSMPDSSTGNYSIGSWREGDLLYVLVVNGNSSDYRSFLRTPAPLT